jgi:YD repeat-containing protein
MILIMRIIILFSVLGLSCAIPKDLSYPEWCEGECEELPASNHTVLYAPNPSDKPCEEVSQDYLGRVLHNRHFYDADGDLQETITYNGSTPIWRKLFFYNKEKQLLSDETRPIDEPSTYTLRIEYAYNSAGLVSSETLSLFVAGCKAGPVRDVFKASGGGSTLERVEAYEVCGSTEPYQHKLEYTYDKSARLIREDLSTEETKKSSSATYSYKRRQQIKSYDGKIERITRYNRAGEKKSVETWSKGKKTSETNFTYDALGRLLEEEGTGTRTNKITYRYECK